MAIRIAYTIDEEFVEVVDIDEAIAREEFLDLQRRLDEAEYLLPEEYLEMEGRLDEAFDLWVQFL